MRPITHFVSPQVAFTNTFISLKNTHIETIQ
jgi:hypothetical protein